VHPTLVFAIAVVFLAVIVAARSAVLVPEGNAYVVEQLGRYSRTLDPGFHLLMPFVETVRARHALAEQALPIAGEPCRTRDDREVFFDGTLAYRISDPERATYGIADVRGGLAGVTRHAQRGAVQDVMLEELHASRSRVEAAVLHAIGPTTTPWGIEPLRYLISDISRHRKESHT
jgi:regulator of protease activity HflC (stomatin/prohibitin superfamily)